MWVHRTSLFSARVPVDNAIGANRTGSARGYGDFSDFSSRMPVCLFATGNGAFRFQKWNFLI
jgi:hypothetical protein